MIFAKLNDKWHNKSKPQDTPLRSLKSVMEKHGRVMKVLKTDNRGLPTMVNINDK